MSFGDVLYECVWGIHTSPEENIHAHYDETGGEKAEEDAEFVGEGGHGGVGGDVVRVVIGIGIGSGCGCGVGHFDDVGGMVLR